METPLLKDLPISINDQRPYGGINIFSSTVKNQSRELFQLCKQYCNLDPSHKILDFGCGTGRLLSHLRSFSKHSIGFDICYRYITYCRCYNFPAYHMDVEHPEFNPTGSISPLTNFLPYSDALFDRIICVAVLNHNDTIRASRIVSEALRVTKKRGVILFTGLFLNNQSITQLKQNSCAFEMYELDNKNWTVNFQRPYLNCALDEITIRRTIIENSGQVIEPIHYGNWRKIPNAVTGHDLLVVKKI